MIPLLAKALIPAGIFFMTALGIKTISSFVNHRYPQLKQEEEIDDEYV